MEAPRLYAHLDQRRDSHPQACQELHTCLVSVCFVISHLDQCRDPHPQACQEMRAHQNPKPIQHLKKSVA
eukprot:9652413-Karenia_brevis.AAC.1